MATPKLTKAQAAWVEQAAWIAKNGTADEADMATASANAYVWGVIASDPTFASMTDAEFARYVGAVLVGLWDFEWPITFRARVATLVKAEAATCRAFRKMVGAPHHRGSLDAAKG